MNKQLGKCVLYTPHIGRTFSRRDTNCNVYSRTEDGVFRNDFE